MSQWSGCSRQGLHFQGYAFGDPNNFTNLNKTWHGAVRISEVLLYLNVFAQLFCNSIVHVSTAPTVVKAL